MLEEEITSIFRLASPSTSISKAYFLISYRNDLETYVLIGGFHQKAFSFTEEAVCHLV